MKGKAFLSSMLLGLVFPINTFANTFTPAFISYQNQDNFNTLESNTLESIEIAQQTPQPNQQSANYVASALRSYPSSIFNAARELSGSKVRWQDVDAESKTINGREWILLTISGTVPIDVAADPKIAIYLWARRNNNGEFNFVDHDFKVWGSMFSPKDTVRQEAERRLRNLPNYYPRFNELLDLMLRCRLQRDTQYSYGVSGC
ncbi:MAG: hypothetical protein AB4060_03080 [Crocosphaera sp.]